MKVNDVVQFNENHKWCGCLGIIEKVYDKKFLVGVPMPNGAAFIFTMESDNEIELIGRAVLGIAEEV